MLALGVVVAGGCDAVPGLEAEERQPPRVSNLQIVTDSIEISDADSLARVTLDLSARAADPDGTIVQVVFLLEPSSNPQGTASGELRSVEGSLYAERVGLTVPLVEEIYAVRVFAVDDDSLASNKVTGQFRFEPPAQSEATAAGSLSSAAIVPFAQRPVWPLLSPPSDVLWHPFKGSLGAQTRLIAAALHPPLSGRPSATAVGSRGNGSVIVAARP